MFHFSGTELFALLLMVLEWTRPVLLSPLRPICDLRVLDHFIKEAQDAEVAMRSCREGCGLVMPVTVPQSRVDFAAWETKNTVEQAREVQAGLWLLKQAMGSLQSSVSNAALRGHTASALRNMLSIGQVLRSLSIQEFTALGALRAEETWRVSTASELLQVHVNFLRGKVRLLLSNAPACHQDVS
ncbi:erythropoietin [Osmerus mordax]|uniref:erythropoietin n=1 Tax=Osmerus mordax TaxID=8014 RepID=UPI00350FAD31